MEAKELKITIPEGQKIDWQESAKQEKIVFKKIDTKPRSWVEYCELQRSKHAKGYLIDSEDIYTVNWDSMTSPNCWSDVLPSKELIKAFQAMMQLMSVRDSWIKDWDSTKLGNAIRLDVERNIMVTHDIYHGPLTFPTREMALDFMHCFKDLLEIAKPLI